MYGVGRRTGRSGPRRRGAGSSSAPLVHTQRRLDPPLSFITHPYIGSCLGGHPSLLASVASEIRASHAPPYRWLTDRPPLSRKRPPPVGRLDERERAKTGALGIQWGREGGCDRVGFPWGPRVPPGTLDPGSGRHVVRARRPPRARRGAPRRPPPRRGQHLLDAVDAIRGHVPPGAMASAQRESSTRRRLGHIPLPDHTFCAACPRPPPLALFDVRRDAQAAPSRFRPSCPGDCPERRSETRKRKRGPRPFQRRATRNTSLCFAPVLKLVEVLKALSPPSPIDPSTPYSP